MKFFILLVVFTSNFAFAGSDLNLKITGITTFGRDYRVNYITDARLQVSVSSVGSFIRRDCYKEYESNFPYSAQTISYTISQNYRVDFQNNVLRAYDLKEDFARNKKELKDFLNFGCKTSSSGILMVRGVLANGKDFTASPNVSITKEGLLLLQVGSLQIEAPDSEQISIELTPSVLYGQNWDKVWDEPDPGTLVPQRNF